MKVMKCICCEKAFTTSNNIGSFIGSTTCEVSCGYGSENDGDIYEILICDQCLDEKFKKDVAIYRTNYMGYTDEKKLQKSNKALTRMKNLKKLLE